MCAIAPAKSADFVYVYHFVSMYLCIITCIYAACGLVSHTEFPDFARSCVSRETIDVYRGQQVHHLTWKS